jgi:hypothetical protein
MRLDKARISSTAWMAIRRSTVESWWLRSSRPNTFIMEAKRGCTFLWASWSPAAAAFQASTMKAGAKFADADHATAAPASAPAVPAVRFRAI